MRSFRYIFCLLCFLSLTDLIAQTDAHYWTHQYGGRGLLLNGAVIASTDAETAIYYNPGAMALNENLGFSFTFLTPNFTSIRTTNFLGEGTSFSNSGFGLTPGFASIRFKPFSTPNLIAGVTTFTRYKSELRFQDRVLGNIPGLVDFVHVGELDFEKQLSEQWFGLGLSYRIGEDFSFGFTQFLTWHGERISLDFEKEIFPEFKPLDISSRWRSNLSYEFSANSGFLTKVGLAWKPKDIHIGITLTTPGYAFLYSNAKYLFDDEKIFNPDSTVFLSNLREVDIEEYKTPLSIGFGMDFTWNEYRMSISTEYFMANSNYVLISDSDDSYDGLVSGVEPLDFVVALENEEVINLAIGIEKRVSDRTTWMWGFRTDFNQRSNIQINDNIQFLASSPSVLHLSAGGVFLFGDNQISVGLDYGYGFKSGGSQLTDLSNITTENLFTFSSNNTVKTYTHSITLFFTYDFIFDSLDRS